MSGMMPPTTTSYVLHALLAEQIPQPLADVHVSPAQDGQPDDVSVFPQGGGDDLFRRLPQACR